MGGSGSGKPKGELLVLDGHELINGKLEKTDFFKFLGTDLSDYSDIKMTPEQALAFKNQVVRMTHGASAALTLWCAGPQCINKTCPFHDGGGYPLGKACILEARMIQYLTRAYVEDTGVDPDSPTEMTLINQLVECDIIDYRANLGLSGASDEEAGTLLKTNRVESEHGVAETTNLHPLLDAKERANSKRIRILEALVKTRKEEYKKAAALKQKETNDSSNFLADLRRVLEAKKVPKNQLAKIAEAADAASNTIDADWAVKDGE